MTYSSFVALFTDRDAAAKWLGVPFEALSA